MNLWGRVKSAASVLWRGTVSEATFEEVFGTLVPVAEYFTANGRLLSPVGRVYGPEQRPEKNATLRTLQDHDRARNSSRVLAETNPNAIGLLQRLQAYNVGKGSSTEVQSADEDREPPKRLAGKVRSFLKSFRKQNTHGNRWLALEKEMVWRLHVDGEFFLRFYPQADGVTLVRFVEPANVRPPVGEDGEGDWSFGFYTPGGDVEAPEAYNVHDFRTQADEVVEAALIIHAKINCTSSQKRGVPSLYAVEGELIGAAKLRHATREGEKNRASINYFRRHKTAGKGAIEGLRDSRARVVQALAGADAPADASSIYLEVIEPGSTVDIPDGIDPLPPPGSPNTEGSSRSVDAALESVAARFGVPTWVVSGKSDGGNFAQALVSESPFTITIEDFQGSLAEVTDAAQTKALEIGAEQGLLPEDVLEQIDLMVSFPSPVSRNKKEETDRRKILHEDGIISRTTRTTEEGYDPEKQQQQLREEAADAPLPLPAADGNGVAPAVANGTPSSTPAARYAALVNRPQTNGN